MKYIKLIAIATLLSGCASFDTEIKDTAEIMREVCNEDGSKVTISVYKTSKRESVKATCTWITVDF